MFLPSRRYAGTRDTSEFGPKTVRTQCWNCREEEGVEPSTVFQIRSLGNSVTLEVGFNSPAAVAVDVLRNVRTENCVSE